MFSPLPDPTSISRCSLRKVRLEALSGLFKTTSPEASASWGSSSTQPLPAHPPAPPTPLPSAGGTLAAGFCSPTPPRPLHRGLRRRTRTHAAMPEAARSFDRLCPGGRPFLCVEEILRDWAVLAKRHLAAPSPSPGSCSFCCSRSAHEPRGTPSLPVSPARSCGNSRNEEGKTLPPFWERGSRDGPRPPAGRAGREQQRDERGSLPTWPRRVSTSSWSLSASPGNVGPRPPGEKRPTHRQ